MNSIKMINGYQCRFCNECKRDINVNSMVPNADICQTCLEDTTVIKRWEITEGDYNDLYGRENMSGTAKEIEKYVLSKFNPRYKRRIEDLGTDSIGYGILNKDGTCDYYVEAREVEE